MYDLRHPVKATEVTTDLAQNNGSLPLGGWLNYLQAYCLYTGTAPGPKLGNEYERISPF